MKNKKTEGKKNLTSKKKVKFKKINLPNFSLITSDLTKFDLSKYSVLCATSLIIDEEIDRTWTFIRDVSYSQKIATHIMGTYLNFYQGANTFSLNSIFSFFYVNCFDMFVKCAELSFSEKKYQITWECFASGVHHTQTTTLYKISDINDILENNNENENENNIKIKKTLLKTVVRILDVNSKVYIRTPKIETEGEFYGKSINQLYSCYNKYISQSFENLFDYQSFVINKNYIKVWYFIINLKNLGFISSIIGRNYENSDDPEKIGTFWKCISNNEQKIDFFVVTNVVINKKKKFREYVVETFGTENSFIKQEMKIRVTKVNLFKKEIINELADERNERCQVSFTHTFKEKVTEKYLFYFNKIKHDFLENLKENLQKI